MTRRNWRFPLTWLGDIACFLLLIVAGISWWIVGYSAECLLRGCS